MHEIQSQHTAVNIHLACNAKQLAALVLLQPSFVRSISTPFAAFRWPSHSNTPHKADHIDQHDTHDVELGDRDQTVNGDASVSTQKHGTDSGREAVAAADAAAQDDINFDDFYAPSRPTGAESSAGATVELLGEPCALLMQSDASVQNVTHCGCGLFWKGGEACIQQDT